MVDVIFATLGSLVWYSAERRYRFPDSQLHLGRTHHTLAGDVIRRSLGLVQTLAEHSMAEIFTVCEHRYHVLLDSWHESNTAIMGCTVGPQGSDHRRDASFAGASQTLSG